MSNKNKVTALITVPPALGALCCALYGSSQGAEMFLVLTFAHWLSWEVVYWANRTGNHV